MFVSQLTNIHVLCSSVADIFIDFDTKDYSAVTFLKYIKTEEDTLFLCSEGFGHSSICRNQWVQLR
jgi:hypothetical protein